MNRRRVPLPSDGLPLPLTLTNTLFVGVFLSSTCYLLVKWQEKASEGVPITSLTSREVFGVLCNVGSVVYLIGFFGILWVQQEIGPEVVPARGGGRHRGGADHAGSSGGSVRGGGVPGQGWPSRTRPQG